MPTHQTNMEPIDPCTVQELPRSQAHRMHRIDGQEPQGSHQLSGRAVRAERHRQFERTDGPGPPGDSTLAEVGRRHQHLDTERRTRERSYRTGSLTERSGRPTPSIQHAPIQIVKISRWLRVEYGGGSHHDFARQPVVLVLRRSDRDDPRYTDLRMVSYFVASQVIPLGPPRDIPEPVHPAAPPPANKSTAVAR